MQRETKVFKLLSLKLMISSQSCQYRTGSHFGFIREIKYFGIGPY